MQGGLQRKKSLGVAFGVAFGVANWGRSKRNVWIGVAFGVAKMEFVRVFLWWKLPKNGKKVAFFCAFEYQKAHFGGDMSKKNKANRPSNSKFAKYAIKIRLPFVYSGRSVPKTKAILYISTFGTSIGG